MFTAKRDANTQAIPRDVQDTDTSVQGAQSADIADDR